MSASDPRLADAVTVVVASMDRREELLASLPRHEAPVVLVDNGSSDGTVAAVRERLPHVQVVPLPANRGAAARTLGVQRATTRYVAFADDDSWWEPGSLARAVELLDAFPRAALLQARILVGEEERLDPFCTLVAGSPLGAPEDLPGPSLLGFIACAAVVRRDAFLSVGGFDDVVVFPGEEERVALDLVTDGWGLAYVDSLVVHHHPKPSASRDSTQRRRTRIARSWLLTALMRRPWPVVAQRVRRTWSAGPADRAALREALPSVPAALRARRPVPAAVEAMARLLEDGG
jgi:GT2 family glycosyltransferase